MVDVAKQLTELLARMPELQWQLSKQASSFSPAALPPGLFRQPYDAPTGAYINEIKSDISTLMAFHANERILRYLALKINQKINVLVTLCSRHNRQQPELEPVSYAVDKMTTRQQWLLSLESNIQTLTEQRDALSNALMQKNNRSDSALHLNLARELGELERRLTLARETYTHALS